MPLIRRYRRTYRRGGLRYRRPVRRALARYKRTVPRPVLRYKRNLNKPEIKHYDQVGAGGGIGNNPANWSMYYLTAGIIQGTSNVTRVGSSIRINSVGITADITRNASGNTVQRVRCMLVKMSNTFNSAPTASELFQTTSTFLPLRDLDYMTYYRVLMDRIIVLDSAIHNQITLKYNRRQYAKARYTGNGGTFGDQSHGGYYFLIWSDQASNQPTLANLNMRVCFSDL